MTAVSRFSVPASAFLAGIVFLSPVNAEVGGDLASRVVTLEQRVESLEAELALIREEMRAMLGSSGGSGDFVSARLSTTDVSQGSVQPANTGVSNPLPGGGAGGSGSGSGGGDDASNGFGQEMFIARDSVPVLRNGSFDLSYEVNYGRNSSIVTTERSVGMATALRYGVTNRFEVGARVNGFYAHRVTATGPGRRFVTDNFGLGDSEVSASYLVLQQKRGRPGMSLNAAAIIPGSDPYFFAPGFALGVAPLDNTIGYQSHGHWGGRVNAQFFLNADPLVFFWGGGVEYLFDKRKAGYTISRGLRYAANVGASLALTERTTVSNSLQFSYEGRLAVNGVPVVGSDSENFLARFTLVQRIGDSTFFEPGFSFGLTDETQDVLVTLGFRKQW